MTALILPFRINDVDFLPEGLHDLGADAINGMAEPEVEALVSTAEAHLRHLHEALQGSVVSGKRISSFIH